MCAMDCSPLGEPRPSLPCPCGILVAMSIAGASGHGALHSHRLQQHPAALAFLLFSLVCFEMAALFPPVPLIPLFLPLENGFAHRFTVCMADLDQCSPDQPFFFFSGREEEEEKKQPTTTTVDSGFDSVNIPVLQNEKLNMQPR